MRRPGSSRWRHRAFGQVLLTRLAAGYIRLVARTGRWQLRCDPAAAALIRAREPFIAAAWHGRLLMMFPAWCAALRALNIDDPAPPWVVASGHGDGRLVAGAMARFGLPSVFGSSRRGGASALRAAHRLLRAGHVVALTPDGPRGPRMRAQPGIVQLARRNGVPIVPITFASAHHRILGSWDRFALPLPFDRGILAFGAPLGIAPDAELEAARAAVEWHLSALTCEIDRALGRLPSGAPA